MGIKFDYKFKSKLNKIIFENGDGKKFYDDFRDKAQNKIIDEIPPVILEELNAGNTPVQGGLYKKSYSDSYKKQIQKQWSTIFGKANQPVNLRLSGVLHESLKATKISQGVNFNFDDPIAKYHDKLGAGKSKVIRRMLPRTGEAWNKRITKKFMDIFKSVMRSFV